SEKVAPIVAPSQPQQIAHQESNIKASPGTHAPLSTIPAQTQDDDEVVVDPGYNEWLKRIVDELATRDDPNSLVAAALLYTADGPLDKTNFRQHLLKYLQRAAALAPRDASIQALTSMACETTPGCNPSPYEKTLRAIDPKNALGWYGAFLQAAQDKDHDAVVSALASMSATERFDWHWNENISHVVDAFESTRVPPPGSLTSANLPILRNAVAVNAIGVWAALATPPFAPLTNNCKSDDLNIVAYCTKIGAALEHGDNLLVASIGLAIEKNIAAAETPEAARITEAQRQLRWLMNGQAQFSGMNMDEWLRLLKENHSEMDAIRSLLVAHGMPATPPDGWTPGKP
ncbi:MAG TPA: hypothetical protein VET48_08210, partial [Steroidobacteraceae bacterium]|nr:hypothetical protein [Steroidobacteraceae bacterium]